MRYTINVIGRISDEPLVMGNMLPSDIEFYAKMLIDGVIRGFEVYEKHED